ncbi:proton-conducting transporter membrane subunit, partial [Paraconexibacter sp.]|uniref:proton-conducting transporter transmembrane domain-containing protein n=1 Tax=Paraconexibacter sp. TaxID=2949640 RepID=UPI0035652BE2
AGLLTTATAATVASATLVGLALAWSLSSVALCALLALYRGFPAADEGVRRTVRAFVIGDGALWAAVTVAVLTWGDLNLRALATAGLPDPADPTTITIVALLLVVAAMARSAQVPLQSWLPATIAAPTPVSALLHAGMINGGGVLLVRTSPIFGASTAATHLAFAVGATTAIYGTALMLAKPDVKGALAHSTMGQMGFMVMTCGLGAFGAAIFHLVAHGLYKSTLFLGSGGAMRRHARHLKAPPRPALAGAPQLRAIALAAALPAGAIVLGDALLPAEPLHGHGGTALLIFAWATGAALTWGWLRRTPSLLGTLALVPALGIATLAYLGALRTATGFLDPSLVAAGTDTVSAWALLPVLAIGGALSLIRAPRFERHTRRAHEQLYVWALGAGHLGRRPTRRRTPPRQAAAWPGILIPRSEGGHS